MKRALAALLLASATSCVAPGPHVEAPPAAQGDGTSYALVNGAWLRVRVLGEKSEKLPVVFLHGYGSRLESWRLVQPALAADRLTVSLDQRGFGLSERPADGYGPDGHAQDVVALLDRLGIEKAVVVGHSYGGGVALRVALDHPERVAGLALVSAFAFEDQIPTAFRWAQVPLLGEALFSAFYEEVPGEKYLLAFHDRQRFVSAAALEEMKALMAKEGSTYAALWTVRRMSYAPVEHRYRDVRVPTTLVWGQDDRVTPISVGRRFAGVFDHARFVELPSCGHMPSWERPEALTAALRDLLARADGAAAPPSSMPLGPPPSPAEAPAPASDVAAPAPEAAR